MEVGETRDALGFEVVTVARPEGGLGFKDLVPKDIVLAELIAISAVQTVRALLLFFFVLFPAHMEQQLIFVVLGLKLLGRHRRNGVHKPGALLGNSGFEVKDWQGLLLLEEESGV